MVQYENDYHNTRLKAIILRLPSIVSNGSDRMDQFGMHGHWEIAVRTTVYNEYEIDHRCSIVHLERNALRDERYYRTAWEKISKIVGEQLAKTRYREYRDLVYEYTGLFI